MTEKPGNTGRPKRALDPRNAKFTGSWMLFWFLILAVVPLLWIYIQKQNNGVKKFNSGEFEALVNAEQVRSVILLTRNQRPVAATGEYYLTLNDDPKGERLKDEQGNERTANNRARLVPSD
jgi:hypothetical protein